MGWRAEWLKRASPEAIEEYRRKNRERSKRWHHANKDTQNRKRSEHYRNNREAHRASNRLWIENNRQQNAAYKADWYRANKARIQQRMQARASQVCANNRLRRATDIQYAIAGRLRTRMQKALRACGAQRARKTAELLGCSIEDFRSHIERQFLKGMTWDNRSQWHLDHIRPIAGFDLTDAEQQLACFHFTNIRPLWRRDNQQKSGRSLLLL